MVRQSAAFSTCQPLTSRPSTPLGSANGLSDSVENERVVCAAEFGSYVAIVEPIEWFPAAFISASVGLPFDAAPADSGERTGAGSGALLVLGTGAAGPAVGAAVGTGGVGAGDGVVAGAAVAAPVTQPAASAIVAATVSVVRVTKCIELSPSWFVSLVSFRRQRGRQTSQYRPDSSSSSSRLSAMKHGHSYNCIVKLRATVGLTAMPGRGAPELGCQLSCASASAVRVLRVTCCHEYRAVAGHGDRVLVRGDVHGLASGERCFAERAPKPHAALNAERDRRPG